jgi:transposase
MLNRDTRIAILELSRRGKGIRAVARAVGVSRGTVRTVLDSDQAERPDMRRGSQLDEHIDRIRELHDDCKGNLVRVHEELAAGGVAVGYTTLTAFCREKRIGVVEKTPAGRYHFEPGEEMQHDTSPHDVKIGERTRRLQCASDVLAYSQMIFAQLYPTFDRFYAKTFLTDGVVFFDGAAKRCMVDNTNVVVAHGTGARAVIAPEMEAFGTRFGFTFVAHEKGDANRSARVERPFDYIENNFYAGRKFRDLADANAQLRAWCEKVNGLPKDRIHTTPLALFAAERPLLQPLPPWIPEVTRIEERRVDVERYVTLHLNRYSAPPSLIDHMVEVHETIRHVRVFYRHKMVAEHDAFEPGLERTSTLPQHKRAPGSSKAPPPIGPEEAVLVAAGPEFVAMIALMRTKYLGRALRPIRRLHVLFLEYPTETLRKALAMAVEHKVYDVVRIERIVLRMIGSDWFLLPITKDDP